MKTEKIKRAFFAVLILGVFTTSARAEVLFSDDFESGSLDKWVIGGRQGGVANVAEVISRGGSQMGHLYHKGFTEITIEKTFAYNPNLSFSFDMEAYAIAINPVTGADYARGGADFTFLDASGDFLGQVGYDHASSSYFFDYCNPLPQHHYFAIPDGAGVVSYNLNVRELLSYVDVDPNSVASVNFKFIAYTSGWYYSETSNNMYADVWVDNVIVQRPRPGIYYVDGVNGSDLNDGLTLETAFTTIQKGVEEANDSDTVLVYPAVYAEAVNFDGKAITVQGVATEAGVPIVETPMDYAFSFYTEEEPNSVLKNFVVRDSYLAAFLIDAAPTISNLTIVDNRFGIEAYAGSQPGISNCIFYNNTNGDLFGCEARYSWVGEDVNEPNEPNMPMFVDAAGGDYRLKSERGRYWPEHDVWVLDEKTSPCIDGGDPNDNPGDERMPNGGRINMGAYGGTAYASMSEWLMTGDVSKDGIVNFKDIAIVAGQWLDFMPWAWNEPPEVVITSPDGSETVPYNTIDPVVIEADASDSDGTVVKVEFFADAIKVAEDNNGANGWQGAWHPVSDGQFTLTAKATDDDGATATSPAVQVEVGYVW